MILLFQLQNVSEIDKKFSISNVDVEKLRNITRNISKHSFKHMNNSLHSLYDINVHRKPIVNLLFAYLIIPPCSIFIFSIHIPFIVFTVYTVYTNYNINVHNRPAFHLVFAHLNTTAFYIFIFPLNPRSISLKNSRIKKSKDTPSLYLPNHL